MRFAHAIAIAAALTGFCVAAVSAEPPARTTYKAPIVASLAPDEGSPAASASQPSTRRTARTQGRGLLRSPGAQLATTAAVFVMAMFLASLASKRS